MQKLSYVAVEVVFVTALLVLPIVLSTNEPIPADKAQLNSWFDRNVGPLASREGSLDPAVVEAEKNVTVVQVRADGSGDFKTITDAVKSVPHDNKHRVVISIGPGNYTEKVKIDRYTHFITLYGDPKNMPVMVFDGTAAQFGTLDSGTLSVESDYFSAVNLIFVNSAPRPDGKEWGLRRWLLKSPENMRLSTTADSMDFKTPFATTGANICTKIAMLRAPSTSSLAVDNPSICALEVEARRAKRVCFCTLHVTGTGGTGYLGRTWFPFGRVIYAYSQLSEAVNPEGWSNNGQAHTDSTVYFGEYRNQGPGADLSKRAPFAKLLSDAEVKPFISLSYIEGSKWLLPPTTPRV
ncbi:UNVERIFIED_CONTAM: Pectinesterase 2 [Sesamum radiatum]|uniref:pectinesterase n=1 Tax=Sesamum radiatum TaxID=300843 RepID=A0AAW2JBR8_SESRA